MKRALVVGSRGQDGRLLRERLKGLGYFVAGLSRQGVETDEGLLSGPVGVDDPVAVETLVGSIAPDEIYYLAAFHHSSQQAADMAPAWLWERSMAVNVAGPVNFMEAMLRRAPRARFFYAGSCLAFGKPERTPQNEETAFKPRCVYGITKAAGSHAVRCYRETHGLFAVTGILYNHESHLRPEHFLSRKIVNAAWRIKQGLQKELVLADLSARADWGYAPDFIEAFRLTLAAGVPDDYVIATGELREVLDWVKKTFALACLDWQEHVREDPGLAIRRRAPLVGDISRVRSVCGWSPVTSFDRMVELMFDNEGRH